MPRVAVGAVRRLLALMKTFEAMLFDEVIETSSNAAALPPKGIKSQSLHETVSLVLICVMICSATTGIRSIVPEVGGRIRVWQASL